MSGSTTTHAIEVVFRPSGGPETAAAAEQVSASVVQLNVASESGAVEAEDFARAQLRAAGALNEVGDDARAARASIAALSIADNQLAAASENAAAASLELAAAGVAAADAAREGTAADAAATVAAGERRNAAGRLVD